MPKYRVLEKSFINDAIREEGDIVEYSGRPSANLELVDEAEKPVAKGGKPGGKKSADADEGTA